MASTKVPVTIHLADLAEVSELIGQQRLTIDRLAKRCDWLASEIANLEALSGDYMTSPNVVELVRLIHRTASKAERAIAQLRGNGDWLEGDQ